MIYKFLSLLMFVGCTQDYGVINSNEVVVTETVIQEVEVEVEIPVYVEVEVPVNEGVIWVDSFTQHNEIEGIDILWVVDRSGSMGRYDAELLNGLEAMLLALPSSDWRLVIINADPGRAVMNNQFPLVPGDTIVDAEDMLMRVGTGFFEQGFNSVHDYIMLNPYSSTWMRPEAGLLVVFVSDEEEQSDADYPLTSDFLSWYQMQKMGSVFMASIVNHEPSISLCTNRPSPIDEGKRYIEATLALGGGVVDICDTDWSPGVTDAANSLDPYESLTLTHVAEPDSIRVFINGALNHDWYYSSSDNTVYFTVIPSAGQLVEIGYRYIEQDTGDTGP